MDNKIQYCINVQYGSLSMAVCPQVIYKWKVCTVRYLQSQYFTCVSPQYTCGGPTD